MLKTTTLTYTRNDKPILHNLSFQVSPGQILIVRGANGSGKTTLLRLIAGFSAAEQGSIQNNFKQSAYLGHQSGLKLELTPFENAHYVVQLVGQQPTQLQEILYQVGIKEVQHQRCQDLSAGQRQRAAMACLLLQNAELWLLDEPGTHLDDKGRALLFHIIEQHCAKGGAVVMAVHGEWPAMQAEQMELTLEEAA